MNLVIVGVFVVVAVVVVLAVRELMVVGLQPYQRSKTADPHTG